MTTLNIIDISHVENYCPQDRLVPDELQNCHSHYRWDRKVWEVAYYHGYREPRFPVPAIPLQVKYDYAGCVNIDDVTDPDDPIIVWMYDSWTGRDVTNEAFPWEGVPGALNFIL